MLACAWVISHTICGNQNSVGYCSWRVAKQPPDDDQLITFVVIGNAKLAVKWLA